MTHSKRRLLTHGRVRTGSIILSIFSTLLVAGPLGTAIILAWQLHSEESSRIKSELEVGVLGEWELGENVTVYCEVDELANEPNRLELVEGGSFEQISEEIFTSTLRRSLESLHPQNVLDSYLVVCTRQVPVLLLGITSFGQRTDFEIWVRYEVKAPFDKVVVRSFWFGSPPEAVVRE